MNCQNCKREINENDEFCGGCGFQLEIPVSSDPDSCPSCLTKMKQNQTHCQKCGSSRDLFKKEDPEPIAKNRFRHFRIPGIILSIVGLGIVIFAYINFQIANEALRTDNNPAIGLQAVMSVPIGIIGIFVLIVGISFYKSSKGD
jgi:hypothetical protein